MTQSSITQVLSLPVSAAGNSAAFAAGNRLRGLRRSIRTTPGLLRASLAGLWMLVVFFAWSASVTIERHRQEMQSIGKDSAPSIIAAQSIKLNIAQLHGDVIRQFLGSPLQATDAAAQARVLRQKVSGGLLNAATNITYGDAERVPIQNLLDGLSEYDDSIARAEALHRHGADEYLPPLRDATSILDQKLCPAADALDKANQDSLTYAYTQDQSTAQWSTVLMVICGIAILAGLLGVQLLIQRRMHRRISIPLVSAALLALIWTGWLVAVMQSETADLKTAKEDAFDSIGAMSRARSAVFNAQSHLAMSLLDPQSAASARQVFADDSSDLARFSNGQSFESVQTAIDRAVESSGSDITLKAGSLPAGFEGYLAAELNNITFERERDAAVDLFRQYTHYEQIARKVQETDHAGLHALAAGLCLGDAADEAGGALKAVDSDLDQILSINQREFDAAVERGFGEVSGLELWNYGIAAAAALLVYLVMAKRMAEYQV